jgi:hypothetical protein
MLLGDGLSYRGYREQLMMVFLSIIETLLL